MSIVDINTEEQTTTDGHLSAVNILAAICAAADVSPSDVVGHSKRTELVIPRHLFVWMLRHHMGWTVRHTARAVMKSPSTIWQSALEAEHLLRFDKHMIRLYSRTLSMLGQPHGYQTARQKHSEWWHRFD